MNSFVAGSLLNYHEGVGTQGLTLHHGSLSLGCQFTTKNWLQVVILPAITATQPVRVRLEHEALSYVFKDWDARTRDTLQLYWGGKVLRNSKVYLAAVVVDHPQLDKFVGGGKYTTPYIHNET